MVFKTPLKNMISSKIINRDIKVMGVKFSGRLGLAAGFDKNGDYLNFTNNIGLGFVEVGTVTPKAQVGNKKPRIFRLTDELAIINHLGFNNKGVMYLKEKLKGFDRKVPIGVNIGKNANTSIENAYEDYIYCMNQIYEYSDYITLNISSPNTENLRDLHDDKYLGQFLNKIKIKHDLLAKKYHEHKPLLLKISPDHNIDKIEELCSLINSYDIAGIIVSNTSTDKSIIKSQKYLDYKGGVSGLPISQKSTQLIKIFRDLLSKDKKIVGCGGVMSREIADEKINAGADLLQVYTGLVFKGLKLIKDINN